jgi:hypothetical protein
MKYWKLVVKWTFETDLIWNHRGSGDGTPWAVQRIRSNIHPFPATLVGVEVGAHPSSSRQLGGGTKNRNRIWDKHQLRDCNLQQ